MPAPERQGFDALTKLALVVSVTLLLARLTVAEHVGWGDAEALYACYALFRQASYLDHPGMLGWLGSLLADPSGVPLPAVAHRFTSAAAMAVPWLGGLAARAAGASWRGAMVSVLALALMPQMAVGLFAFSPDVPLALCWLGALALGLAALRAEPRSLAAHAATVGAGLLAGLACAAKVSGALLALALLTAWLARPARARWRTPAPWAAVAAGALCLVPVVAREHALGWPMLQHRLFSTQAGFGPSLRNLGALAGGQVLYVTPFALVAAVLVAADLARRHDEDAASRLLALSTFVPLAVLSALLLLSRTAEPHWLAPVYVALAVHLGRRADTHRPPISRRLGVVAAATSVVAIAAVLVVVRFPVLPRLLGRHYDPRWDITNDLVVWKEGARLVQESLDEALAAGPGDVVVAGPHWIVCAQLQAAFGRTARVGCETDVGDDFDGWLPRAEWQRAKVILYVTDDRFPVELRGRFADHVPQSVARVGVRRGGVLVRTIRVTRLGRVGAG